MRLRSATGTKSPTSYKKGVRAESLAAFYLLSRGYSLLERRYRARGCGEIDILARKGRTLVAVEVKARSDYEDALYSVTPASCKRIEKAFLHYLSEHPDYADFDYRFDVITIRPPFFIRHMDNAWQPGA